MTAFAGGEEAASRSASFTQYNSRLEVRRVIEQDEEQCWPVSTFAMTLELNLGKFRVHQYVKSGGNSTWHVRE